MIDSTVLATLLMEEQYPFFEDEQLEALGQLSDNINEVMYTACTMKAKADKIKVGPIEIENDASFWTNLADMYYGKWQDDLTLITNGKSRSLTGLIVGRADEY